MDLHYRPYYGDRAAAGIVGGQKKQGTNYFYAYATAELVHRRHRYTVGLLAVEKNLKPHEVVAALLTQLDGHGVRLRGVVLDSGFDSGETLLLLQQRGLAYGVPLRRKGRSGNRRNACFALPVGTVTTVDWVTERTRRPVRTEAVVVRRPGEKRIGVYAFGGWSLPHALSTARAAAAARQGGNGIGGGSASRRATGRCMSARAARRGRTWPIGCCWWGWRCCRGRSGCG